MADFYTKGSYLSLMPGRHTEYYDVNCKRPFDFKVQLALQYNFDKFRFIYLYATCVCYVMRRGSGLTVVEHYLRFTSSD